MKKIGSVMAAAMLAILHPSIAQEITNGDIAKGTQGWTLTPQGSAKATMEAVPDAWEGKPALKVQVTEAPASSWWMLRLSSAAQTKLEPGVSYTLAFFARVEVGSRTLDMGFSANRQKISDRQKLKATEEWQELTYPFTVNTPTDAAALVFDNMAVPDAIYYFANFRITKD